MLDIILIHTYTGFAMKKGKPLVPQERELLDGVLSVRVPKSLLELLERTKWHVKRSKNQIVREAVLEYCTKHLGEGGSPKGKGAK